jgi:hypothetical protein
VKQRSQAFCAVSLMNFDILHSVTSVNVILKNTPYHIMGRIVLMTQYPTTTSLKYPEITRVALLLFIVSKMIQELYSGQTFELSIRSDSIK